MVVHKLGKYFIINYYNVKVCLRRIVYMHITLFGDKLSIAQSNKIRMWADAQRHGRPGGALYERSLIPFLVSRRKVWLTSAARVLCSDAATIGERKT